MNLLELDIREEPEDLKKTYWIKLKVDGVELFMDRSDAVYFEELYKSSKSSGEFLIFTCSCGVADCGGWEKINVTQSNGKVNWSFRRCQKNIQLEFDTLFYVGEIERLKFEIDLKKIVLEPQGVIFPE